MNAQLDTIAPRVAARIGQGTAVEQSRAVAEVHGAIVVAQQVPRDITRAVADMHRSCAQKSLAERAFFRYSRGGSQISGPSVQLARELARCFGNMQYGLVELRRDDEYGQSEMQAWAWDVQTNTRSSTTFIVQHVRDTRSGTTQLTDQRDIYENNANTGARRLREMIFAILPGWYTEDAVAACYATLEGADSEGTVAERIEKATAGFAKLGVTVPMIEQKLGAPRDKWTPYDLAQLTVIYRSLQRGETTREDEFPAAATRSAAAEILSVQQPATPVPAGERVPSEPPLRREPVTVPPKGAATEPEPEPPIGASDFAKLLASVPLGLGKDVNDFLTWKTSHKVGNLKDVTEQERASVAAYLNGMVARHENDPELAATAIWDEFQAEHEAEGGQG